MDSLRAAGFALALLGTAQEPPAPEPASAPGKAPDALAEKPAGPVEARGSGYEPVYHGLDEVAALLASWADSSAPDRILAERVDLPPTGSGLPVPSIAFGAPGPVALAERPTVLLLGGLDGVSLSGSEAVLSVCAASFGDPGKLPRDLAFVAVPWASPEALSRTLAGLDASGRDLSPIDDDGDGAIDEDGPDDLDGDGKVLSMLIEDPAGPWARATDARFLAPARPGDAPRYRLVPEGRDDDGDGRWNEDGPGGVVLDRSFPVGWAPENPLVHGALLPLERPACRALADLALERRTALVLAFQGEHGGLARPGGRLASPWPEDADAAAFELAGRIFARATSRTAASPATIAAASGVERPGAAVDWYYAVPGALALEVAAWGPAVESPASAGGVGLADALFENPAQAGGGRPAAPPVAPADLAWGRWLDNARGGIGFVDWHPVELGDGRQALVGGWEPRSRRNPPVESLAKALQGLPEFVTGLASSLPVLEVRWTEVRRDGDVCTLRARVANQGAIASGGWTSGRSGSVSGRTGDAPGGEAAGTVRIALEVPAGARLLAGEPSVDVGTIPGGGTSADVAWVVLAPAGTVMNVRATAPWAPAVVREVSP